MSDDTKRDVLEKLIECYAEVSDAYTEETGSPYYCDDEPDYIDEYDTALPDDLPVIRQVASDHIKQQKKVNRDLYESLHVMLMSEELADELEFNSEEYAKAWVLGAWRVEETGEIVKLEAEK